MTRLRVLQRENERLRVTTSALFILETATSNRPAVVSEPRKTNCSMQLPPGIDRGTEDAEPYRWIPRRTVLERCHSSGTYRSA